MATQKQIDANRRNAQNSTGPKTEESKAKTRLNALRDGFTGQIVTLSDEDRPIFDKFKSDLIDDFAPETVMERSLADAIAWDTWRLNRIRAIESNIYALGTLDKDVEAVDSDLRPAISDALTFANQEKRFNLMSLYEQRLNRSLQKNLATLLKLRTERKRNRQRDLEEQIILARANDINGLPYEAPARPTENGFVFSNREILTAAHRVTALQAAKMTLKTTPPKVQFAGAASAAQSEMASNLRKWPEPDAA